MRVPVPGMSMFSRSGIYYGSLSLRRLQYSIYLNLLRLSWTYTLSLQLFKSTKSNCINLIKRIGGIVNYKGVNALC